jgi:Protein of unknown function (DUF3631)
MAITSAEKGSGKTRLVEVLELLVRNAWTTADVSPAVLARKLDRDRSTLLFDEFDAIFQGDKDRAQLLRGVFNSGFRLGGTYSRCHGQNQEVRDFSTFSPKALADIGRLPDTISDRSIPIRLQKRRSDEIVKRFRYRLAKEEAAPLREHIERWTAEILPPLSEADPAIPPELGDRAGDIWEPLLAIADRLGGQWPERARTAAVTLSSGRDPDDDSIGVRCLADCRAALDGLERISTEALLDYLDGLEEAPWATWANRGKDVGLKARGLSKLLSPYGIHSKTIRLDDGTAKGFEREQFEDAWSRYLSPVPPREKVTASQPASEAGLRPFSKGNADGAVTDMKGRFSALQAGCDVVTDLQGGNGAQAQEKLPELVGIGGLE